MDVEVELWRPNRMHDIGSVVVVAGSFDETWAETALVARCITTLNIITTSKLFINSINFNTRSMFLILITIKVKRKRRATSSACCGAAC
eukprot:g7304.t1